MAYGLPNISFIGYPVSIPCAGHAGLGLREARRRDSSALVAHLRKLEAEDRRMRFCATLTDQALERHVEEMWSRDPIAIAALDGPLWLGPATAPERFVPSPKSLWPMARPSWD